MFVGMAFGLLMLASVPSQQIVIDGHFEDWKDIPPAVRDPRDDAAGAPIDIADVWVTHDDRSLFVSFDLQQTVNLQVLPGELHLILDADGDASTGAVRQGVAGADWTIVFTPRDPERPERGGMGAGVEVATAEGVVRRSPYDVGLGQAPTFAAGRFEVSIDRKPAGGLTPIGARMRARLAFFDLEGKRRDVTDAFEVALSPRPVPITLQKEDPLLRRNGAPLRLMNWNVLWGSVFEDPAPFSRVLQAVAPDVITFQELTGEDIAGRLTRWLEESHPAGAEQRWTVQVGEVGGGELFAAVASRLPAERVELRIPSRRDRGIRQTLPALILDERGREVLVISIHLPCCGGIGGPQDEARLRMIADLFETLKGWSGAQKIDGVILAGDYNLVGSRTPLDDTMKGLARQFDRGAAIGVPRISGRSRATWRDPKQPFVPGQLDWVVVGGAALQPLGGLVFDTRELAPRWRAAHGLELGDTDASDHLPLIIDFD